MKRSRTRHASSTVFALVASALGVGACAGPPPTKGEASSPASPGAAGAPPQAPAPPSPESAPATGAAERPPPSDAAATRRPAEVAPAQAPGASAGSPRLEAMREAQSGLDRSQRELDVAAGNCESACRALGSMDRSAARLCSLAHEQDEQRRCTEAKLLLLRSRDRVKATCTVCPDGPSVDRSAPIPSGR